MRIAVVDIQGFQLGSGAFMVKELCSYDGRDMSNHLFLPSTMLEDLNSDEKKTTRYLEAHHHGIDYSAGFIGLDKLSNVLELYLDGVERIYVKGADKYDVLLRETVYWRTHPHIINLEMIDIGYPTKPIIELNTPCKFHTCRPITAVCAMNNYTNENYLGWKNRGIGKQLLILSLFTMFSLIIISLKEYNIIRILTYWINRKIKSAESDVTDDDDSDVLEEKRTIKDEEVEPEDCYVLLKDLSKHYKKFLAVDQLCLSVRSFECFGLVGVNGAGKTTTFRMMTGDLSISRGECWLFSYNIKRHPNKAMLYIGYCPQFEALLDELTGYETLMMYGLLSGIPAVQCHVAAHTMSMRFDFYEHLNKRVSCYSGGTKRKLSTAIAILGNSPIIFLDEPTRGMDPGARRKIWDNLHTEREDGKCLILTSHNMQECEALCTRIGIMVNGRVKCLGSPQHLKNKFPQGHVLTIKMNAIPILTRENDVSNIQAFIRQNFTDITLKEDHFGLLIFHIPSESINWPKMFGQLESAKIDLNIDDYTISQSSLEEVFIYIIKSQQPDDTK